MNKSKSETQNLQGLVQDILERTTIRSQRTMVNELANYGVQVDQSTISRTFNKMGIEKIGGRYTKRHSQSEDIALADSQTLSTQLRIGEKGQKPVSDNFRGRVVDQLELFLENEVDRNSEMKTGFETQNLAANQGNNNASMIERDSGECCIRFERKDGTRMIIYKEGLEFSRLRSLIREFNGELVTGSS